jgi:hypothetical protein
MTATVSRGGFDETFEAACDQGFSEQVEPHSPTLPLSDSPIPLFGIPFLLATLWLHP